jgi:hypothetical protein
VNVGDAFEEQEGENVGLEISRINRAPENIGGFPEVGFELVQPDDLSGG